VDFFVPDAPSAYTLEDLGHPAQKAARKARRQGQCTRNKIRTALEIDERARRVWSWAELEGSPAFVRLHTPGRRLYEQDGEFREAYREASEWVLAGKLPEGTVPDEWQVEGAVRYFLAELPLFVDTPTVVGAGASVFCYHQPPEVLRRLYGRELACGPPGAGLRGGLVAELSPERGGSRPSPADTGSRSV
jgi:cyclo(L-tyrosyl-L-tyrosyl) synthase